MNKLLLQILGQNSPQIASLVRSVIKFCAGALIASTGAHTLAVHGIDVSGVVQGVAATLATAAGLWLSGLANTPAAIQQTANANIVDAQATVSTATAATPSVVAAQALL